MRTVAFSKSQRLLEKESSAINTAIENALRVLTVARSKSSDQVDQQFNQNLKQQLDVIALFFGKRVVEVATDNEESAQCALEEDPKYKVNSGEAGGTEAEKADQNDKDLRTKVSALSLKPADKPELLHTLVNMKKLAQGILDFTDAEKVKERAQAVYDSAGQAKQLCKALQKA
eukprot:15300415-Alexandrium_andersonii.AAC.1